MLPRSQQVLDISLSAYRAFVSLQREVLPRAYLLRTYASCLSHCLSNIYDRMLRLGWYRRHGNVKEDVAIAAPQHYIQIVHVCLPCSDSP